MLRYSRSLISLAGGRFSSHFSVTAFSISVSLKIPVSLNRLLAVSSVFECLDY